MFPFIKLRVVLSLRKMESYLIRIGAMEESHRSKPDWQQVRSKAIDRMDLDLATPIV